MRTLGGGTVVLADDRLSHREDDDEGDDDEKSAGKNAVGNEFIFFSLLFLEEHNTDATRNDQSEKCSPVTTHEFKAAHEDHAGNKKAANKKREFLNYIQRFSWCCHGIFYIFFRFRKDKDHYVRFPLEVWN